MALNRIATREMVALTRTMVDPTHEDHRILMARPILAAFMPELTAAHTDVLRVSDAADIALLLRDIIDDQAQIDVQYDDHVRGMWYRLLAEEYLARSREDADMFRRLRETLIPNGLATVNLSYGEEVGHTEMVSERMTPEQEKMLAQLSTHDGDMLQVVRRWLDLGDRLGALERDRASIEVSSLGRGLNLKARNRWFRIVDLMRRATSISGQDPEVDELFSRIQRAAHRAEARALRRDRAGDETPAGDDSPMDDSAVDGAGAVDEETLELDSADAEPHGDDADHAPGDAQISLHQI